MKEYSGSCVCRRVAFRVAAAWSGFFLCHCSQCRKVSGSAHGANLFAQTFTLTWIAGEDAVKTFHHATSRFATAFCGDCGSTLPMVDAGGLKVPAGCLDDAVDKRPDAHIFVGSRASWDVDLSQVQAFDELPA
jgi:hypothetical protein